MFYEGARGRTGPDAATPVAVDSVFRIASMTKAITSAAARKLAVLLHRLWITGEEYQAVGCGAAARERAA